MAHVKSAARTLSPIREWTPEAARRRITEIVEEANEPIPGYAIFERMQSCPRCTYKSQLAYLVSNEVLIRTGEVNKLRYHLSSVRAFDKMLRGLWPHTPSFTERRDHFHRGAR